VALKNAVTFVNKKEQVGLTDSLEGLGLIVQELKGKKTFIVDNGGNGIEGAGTEEDPYVLPKISEPKPTETITTSLTPQVHNGTTYVGAKAVDPEFADTMLLSDGTRQHTGKITYTGHGLTVGKYYYTSQTTAGAITDVKPTTGWVQQLFFVEDANTIQLDIEEAWNPDGGGTTTPTFEPSKIVYVNAVSPTTATIFDLNNPPTTNDDGLKNDSQNLYIGSDGSTWTSNGTVYSTYVYPTTVKHSLYVRKSTTQTIVANGLSVVTNWDAPMTNTAGTGSFNATTGVFTVQRSGYYMLSARLAYDVNQSWTPQGGGRGIRILVNGVGIAASVDSNQTTFISPSFETTGIAFAGPYYLSAGNTVSIDTFANETTSRNLVANARQNTLSIWEV
jgi:hypothetical protein